MHKEAYEDNSRLKNFKAVSTNKQQWLKDKQTTKSLRIYLKGGRKLKEDLLFLSNYVLFTTNIIEDMNIHVCGLEFREDSLWFGAFH